MKNSDSIKFVLERWKYYPGKAILIVLFTILNTGVVLLYPYILGQIVDGLGQGVSIRNIARYILILIGSGLGIVVFYTILQSLRLSMNLILANRIREEIYFKFTGYKASFFKKFKSGDVVARLIDDMERLTWFMSSGIFRGLEGLFLLVFGLVILLRINVLLTLISIVPLFGIITILLFATEELMEKKYKLVQTYISKVNDFLNTSFGGIVFIKVRSKNSLFNDLFKRLLLERKVKEIDAIQFENFANFCYGLGIMTAIAVFLFFGGKTAIAGKITLGNFVAFSQYLIVLIEPMFSLSFFILAHARSKAYIGRLRQLLNDANKEDATRNKDISEFKRKILFKDASLGYDDKIILHDLNFSIKKGEKIGIIGDVGAGKTTLLKGILGIIPPDKGTIAIDDISVSNITYHSISKIFGYTPQESILFTTSIKDNITFSENSIREKKIIRSLNIAEFEKDLSEFKNGIDEQLGTSGKTLSGGQRQRIAIARAIVSSHSIYIFDDITSFLDPETEYQLIHKLGSEIKDKNVFVVSYRPYTLSNMDRIILLKNGKIDKIDTHKNLLKRSVYYRDLLLFEGR
jgi:ATP-binding cassette subfamily B protein